MRIALFATILAGLALFAPAGAEAERRPGVTASVELSSQTRRPPRLRVYPGRLLYRDCTFHLAQERRPNGVFVVPRQHCWWVRG